jgi:hypothetical protein
LASATKARTRAAASAPFSASRHPASATRWWTAMASSAPMMLATPVAAKGAASGAKGAPITLARSRPRNTMKLPMGSGPAARPSCTPIGTASINPAIASASDSRHGAAAGADPLRESQPGRHAFSQEALDRGFRQDRQHVGRRCWCARRREPSSRGIAPPVARAANRSGRASAASVQASATAPSKASVEVW